MLSPSLFPLQYAVRPRARLKRYVCYSKLTYSTTGARAHHGKDGRYLVGDARRLSAVPEVHKDTYDAVVFLLSLQDMDPLEEVLRNAAWALKVGGRAVLLLTHPAFRVPRQSGWGWDEGRKLLYRRVDRYLTPLPVPMKALPGREGSGATRSFHRPLEAYVNGLAEAGMLTERLAEIPGHRVSVEVPHPRAAKLARDEIPLFLGIRAWKVTLPDAAGQTSTM